KVLLLLNTKDVFTQAAVFERAYGWSIIVLGYQDKGLTLKDPVLAPEKIVSLEAYAPTIITSVQTGSRTLIPFQGWSKRRVAKWMTRLK
ncbi:hypothetical protein, partial [Escherichia coli]|uniref:hypothetical protein n=1 Tax=Escherichia coli TaxID=562 RepID=UPI001961AD95